MATSPYTARAVRNSTTFTDATENGAVVRRMVGYRRFEGLEAAEALARLYRPMRLFVNYFQPSFRLAEKRRDGALIRKRYHPPLTPHQRLVADPRTPQAVKEALDAEHAALDPVRLLRDIRAAQQALIEIADKAPVTRTDAPPLEVFLDGLRAAWQSSEDVRPTARSKPSKPRYRTVPDPLEAVTNTLKGWFEADPGVTGRQLLDRLQALRWLRASRPAGEPPAPHGSRSQNTAIGGLNT